MSLVTKYIYNSKAYNKLVEWAKSTHFTNPELSLYLIFVILFKKLKDNEIGTKAGAVAFNFTLAIFPSIIFLFTLVPYLPIENSKDEIFKFLGEFSPNSIYGTAVQTVEDILNKPREGLLSFGFITALVFASNGMMSLMTAFDSCYGVDGASRRGFFKRRGIAAFLTFLLAFILFLTIFLVIAGKLILNFVFDYVQLDNDYLYHLINALRYVAVILMFFLAISVIYYLAPSIPRRWSFVSVGSVFATGLSILFSVVFSFYIDNFGTYNKIYGSIGAMIGVMVWLFAISNVLLLGFEVNSTLDTAKFRLKNLEQELEKELEETMTKEE